MLGDGNWGCTKYRRIPKFRGDWQGRIPVSSLSRKTLQNKGFGAPIFLAISPKLLAALCRMHPYFVHPYFPAANFGEGDERRKIRLSECGGSVNGPDLLTELPFLWNPLPKPSFTECLPPHSVKRRFSSLISASSRPLPQFAFNVCSCMAGLYPG